MTIELPYSIAKSFMQHGKDYNVRVYGSYGFWRGTYLKGPESVGLEHSEPPYRNYIRYHMNTDLFREWYRMEYEYWKTSHSKRHQKAFKNYIGQMHGHFMVQMPEKALYY